MSYPRRSQILIVGELAVCSTHVATTFNLISVGLLMRFQFSFTHQLGGWLVAREEIYPQGLVKADTGHLLSGFSCPLTHSLHCWLPYIHSIIFLKSLVSMLVCQ